jgi:hypothetical protein
MNLRLLALLLSLSLTTFFASAALAQDAEEDPEAGLGDEQDMSEDMGGSDDLFESGDDDAADGGGDDVVDAGDGGDGGPAKPISVALLLGYGLNLDSDATGDLNPFGLGFGVRGGYNIDKIYVGARILFFLGESEDVPGGEVSFNELTIGLVGGYDLEMSGLVLRPELGLGLAISSAEVTVVGIPGAGTVDSSSEDLYVAPGVTVLHNLSPDMFVGGELSIPIILADPDALLGLTIMLTGGMAF